MQSSGRDYNLYHRGDLDSIKVLVENGVDCCIGDYDLRTVTDFSQSFYFGQAFINNLALNTFFS